MAAPDPKDSRIKLTLSAGALTQLLAAIACFLGSFVLPHTFQEFRGLSEYVLIALGVLLLVLGLGNVFFGHRISRMMQRVGRRSRVVIPREGVGYLAIMLVLAVGALLGHRNMPLLVFGLMAGPFVFNGWVVYGMLKGIQVERRTPHRAVAGQLTSVEFVVRNTKRFLATHLLEVSDRISPAERNDLRADQEAMVTFVRIPARQERTGRYRLKFPRRGRFLLGPIRLSSRFPLGIGERGQTVAAPLELIVHPAIGRLLPEWNRQQKELAEANQRVPAGMGLFDDEFHRIREYRDDDNPRAIHWRSTARQGQLMVREFHQTRKADSIVFLDLPQQSDWLEADQELAISFTATLCLQQANAASGATMLLAICGRQNRWIASRSPVSFREEAMDALALCRPSSETDLAGMIQKIAEETSALDDRLIIITPRQDLVTEEIEKYCERSEYGTVFSNGKLTVLPADAKHLNSAFQLEEPSPAGEQSDRVDAVNGAESEGAAS